MEEIFGPLEKKKSKVKKFTSNEMIFFRRTARYNLFDRKKE